MPVTGNILPVTGIVHWPVTRKFITNDKHIYVPITTKFLQIKKKIIHPECIHTYNAHINAYIPYKLKYYSLSNIYYTFIIHMAFITSTIKSLLITQPK
jgi:hypothetical protein